MCTKFQVKSSKTVTGSFRTDERTYRGIPVLYPIGVLQGGLSDIKIKKKHTEDPNRGNVIATEIPPRARIWLVNITSL